jgi:hypothetical protein
MTSKTLKALLPHIPTTEAALSGLLHGTAASQTTLEEATAIRDQKRADAIKAIEDKFGYDQIIGECQRIIDTNVQILEAWSIHNAPRFGKKKSLSLSGVTFGWRSNGWATALIGAKATWKLVTEKLKALASINPQEAPEEVLKVCEIAASLLRTKIEPAKDVMLHNRENPEVLAVLHTVGIGFVEDENFYVRPEREGQEGVELS